jgi:hypothetical protein
MKTNPGGQLEIGEIIGRDKLVDRLWKILARQSLILTAERRMGKTHVLKKLMANLPAGVLAIPEQLPRDLESMHTAAEFVESVFRDAEIYLSRSTRTAKRARDFLSKLGGTEVGGVFKFPEQKNLPWKDILIGTIEDLIEKQEKPVVFIWDEMPLMLFNIAQNQDKQTAMQVLDTLRSLRQTHSNLRMVFTGSIGLHLVLSDLKLAGHANDPTNDMAIEELLPLEHHDACDLAMKLLKGENVTAGNLEEIANEIATSADRIPFYIHHVVDQIQTRGDRAIPGMAEEIVSDLLTDPHDAWHMRYYLERIDTYYQPQDKPFALSILDSLCTSDGSLPFNNLFDLVKSQIRIEDRENCLRVVTLLLRDHYLIQDKNSHYAFRLNLIKRSWQLQRGL